MNEALDQRGARTVASYGVGAALIEVLMLQQRPSRALLLSDYGPATVQRLRDLLPDTTVTLHDLLTDPPPHATCISFHRLDSSLSNRQWRHVFRLFRAQRILFVSSGVLSVGEARQVRSNQKEMRSRGAVYAGRVRTRHAYDVCGDALTVTVACGLVMWTGGGSSLEPDAEALRV